MIIRAGPGTGKTTTLRWRIQNFVQRGIDPRSILALSFTREAQEGLKQKVNIEMQWKDSVRPTFKTFHSLALMVLKAVSNQFPVCQFKRRVNTFDIIQDSESRAFVAEAIQIFNESCALQHGLETLNLFARPSAGAVSEIDIDADITSSMINTSRGLNTGSGGGRSSNSSSSSSNSSNNKTGRTRKHKPRNFRRIPTLPTDGPYVIGMKKWIRAQKNHGVTAAQLMSDASLWSDCNTAGNTAHGDASGLSNPSRTLSSSSSSSSAASSSSSSTTVPPPPLSEAAIKARNQRRRRALIYSKYQMLLEQHEYLDIEDLCPGFLAVLRTHRSVVIQLQSWARFLLVDEFQDLNQTQVEILQHFCGGGASALTKTTLSSSYLTVCGDPDQSIYGFRGALGIHGFAVIEKLFMEQKMKYQREMLKCELLENRRSLPPIVHASNSIIALNYTTTSTAGRLGQKALAMTALSTRRHFKGLVKPLTYKNVHVEVNSIVQTIERLKNDSSTKHKFKDFCILSRTNFGLKLYEQALSKKDIPWKLVGTSRTSETVARGRTGFNGGSTTRPKKKPRRNQGSALDHGVALSTVHQAKGNEWAVVFVVHSTEGMMPIDSTGANLEEERRIFFVAMTRAKEILYLTWHLESSRGRNDPSRFMQESGVLEA